MEIYSDRNQKETAVFSSTSRSQTDACSLVLSAKGIEHRVEQDEEGYLIILVASPLALQATYQIECFVSENRNWPPQALPYSEHRLQGAPPTVLLIGSLVLFYAVTGPWSQYSVWFQSGAGDATAILRHGQWYRLVTALTLHADLSHLAGNCLIGGFLLHFFLQIHGTGLGFCALILSAASGNLINVLVHGGNHLFVGFSTAVFAIIGMLSTHQIVEQRRPLGIRMMVPFMAGAALLAMLGSSGARTDLGGHLFGLLSGFAWGGVLSLPVVRSLRNSFFLQTCLFLAAAAFLFVCWKFALAGSLINLFK